MKRLLLSLLAIALAPAIQAQEVLLEESFEGAGLPAGWEVQTQATDGGWLTGTPAALSYYLLKIPPAIHGSRVAATNDALCDCDKSADRLITPALNFSGYAGILLEMTYFFQRYQYPSAKEEAFIEYSVVSPIN